MMPATKTNSRTTHVRTSRSLRSAAALGLGLLSLLSLSAGTVAHAGTVNWDNTPGDWFANPTHWDNGAYPGAGDDAVNKSTAAMTLGQSTTINSFFSNGAFTLQGGQFSGNQSNGTSTITVNNVFTDDGGQINNFTINQGTNGSLVFTTNGGNSLNNDIINTSVDMSSSSAFVHLYGTDTFNGSISLRAGGGNGIHLDNNTTTLAIGANGSLTGFGGVAEYNGGSVLTNAGTVNANSAGNTLALTTSNFNNSGTAEATNGGVLQLNNSLTNSGTFSAVGAGSVVSIAGSLTGSGSNLFTASGGGQIQINGASLLGTINTDANTALIFNTSGANTLSSATVNGNLDLTSGGTGFVHLYGTDTVNGNISLGAGGSNGIHLDNNTTTFVIGPNGSLTGFGSVSEYNGGSVFNNAGTVNANSAGNTLTINNSNFTNTGTAEATNGGTLSLNNNITNTGTLAAHSGGILDISGTLNANTGNLLDGTGGTLNVMGATLLGTVNLASGSSLVFDTNGGNHLVNTTVNGNLNLATNGNAFVYLFGTDTVNGNISLGAGGTNGIHLDNNTTSFVLNGGLTGFGSISEYNGGSVFTNNGTVNANSAATPLTINNSNFVNTGTAEATNGATLSLNNNITNSAALKAVGAGSVVSLSGTLNSSGNNLITASGGGQVQVNGASLLGTINTDANTALIFNTSGANTLSGTTVNGNLDLTSGGTGFVHLYGTDTVNGNISLGAGGSNGIHLDNNTTSFVLNGNLTGSGSISEYNGGSVFTNNGTVNANSAANPLTLAVSNFNTNGTIEATKGATLNVNNAFTNANAGSTLAAIGTGSVVSLSGTFTGTGNNLITASNGGQVQVNGASLLGTINTDPNTALVFNTSGANLFSNTTVNGNLNLATNSTAFVHLYGTDTVNGSIALGAGGTNGIHLDNNTTTFNLGGSGSLTGFGSVAEYNSGSVFTNNGTVNANSAGNTLALTTTTFTNNKTAEATGGGTLSLNNNTNNNAVLNATGAGSVVSLSGTFTGAGSNLITASGGGQVQVHSASLQGTINTAANTALIFDTSGANNLSNTTVNGNLDLATNSTAFVHLYGTDTVNGNISLGAGGGNGIHLDNNTTTLAVGTNGSLTGFGSVAEYNGGSVFTNNGLVNANSAGNALNISTSNFTNTGTVQVQNGATLNVNNANTDSGNILVKQGGTANFAGIAQTAGLTQVDGTLNSPLTLTGGTLAGTGTVNGNVANNGGAVSAGSSASPFGTLAVSGTFSQTSGVFDVGFSNTQNNLLAVSSAVTTGGLLNVNYLGSGPFTAGNAPFTFLNYGSLTSSITGTGPTQFFSNETFDSSGNGLIAGQNGFLYELLNNTSINGLQLEVLRNGAPTPAVPEASTTVSMGLLLALGGGGLLIAKRRRTAAASQVTAS